MFPKRQFTFSSTRTISIPINFSPFLEFLASQKQRRETLQWVVLWRRRETLRWVVLFIAGRWCICTCCFITWSRGGNLFIVGNLFWIPRRIFFRSRTTYFIEWFLYFLQYVQSQKNVMARWCCLFSSTIRDGIINGELVRLSSYDVEVIPPPQKFSCSIGAWFDDAMQILSACFQCVLLILSVDVFSGIIFLDIGICLWTPGGRLSSCW